MKNPFVGLRPFRTSESGLFFGREHDIAVLANLVLATPVLVLYATSGTGKSSLLNAGLVPELDEDPSLLTLVLADPRDDVEARVRARMSEAGWDGADVSDGGLAHLLERHFVATHRRVILILDQFEERIKRGVALDELYSDIARLANTRSAAATAVLSIREDYVIMMEPLLRRVAGLLDSSFRVPSLTRAELENAVTGPLDAVGRRVRPEPGLVDEVLNDLEREARSGTGTPGRIEAGFFQIVWHDLWEKDATSVGSQLTLRTYESAGRMTGILRAYVHRILSDLPPREAEVLHAAIRYLVLPTGAKMALTVDDLIGLLQEQDFTPRAKALFSLDHRATIRMETIRPTLASVLDRLTLSGAALLRRAVRDDREEFELIHDLVGTILLDWRDQHPTALTGTGRKSGTDVIGDPGSRTVEERRAGDASDVMVDVVARRPVEPQRRFSLMASSAASEGAMGFDPIQERMRFAEGLLVEQFRTSDQLDGKAGVLLGFAGLLAAIVGQLDELNVGVVIGVAAAIFAAFFALMAAFPRSLYEPDHVLVDDQYKRLTDGEWTEAELKELTERVVETITVTRHSDIERNADVLKRKRRWLTAAAVSLLAAGTATGVGMLLA